MNKQKKARRAALYSFLLTGLGQFYNKEKKLGIKLMFFSFLGLLICAIGIYLLLNSYVFFANFTNTIRFKSGIGILGVGLIVIISLGLYSVQEAYNTVSRKEEKK